MYVSDQALESQLRWLGRHYQLVPLSALVDAIYRGSVWERPLCALTFDDGWYDNYEHAFPLLMKYRAPATVFLTGQAVSPETTGPGHWDVCHELMVLGRALPDCPSGVQAIDEVLGSSEVSGNERARRATNMMRELPLEQLNRAYDNLRAVHDALNDDAERTNARYRTLAWNDMRVMQAGGVEFGYHGAHHYMLTQVPDSQLLAELVPPTDRALQHGITLKKLFAYPAGRFDGRVVGHLKELGYVGAVTLINGLNCQGTDPLMLRRVNVHEGGTASLPLFLLQLSRVPRP